MPWKGKSRLRVGADGNCFPGFPQSLFACVLVFMLLFLAAGRWVPLSHKHQCLFFDRDGLFTCRWVLDKLDVRTVFLQPSLPLFLSLQWLLGLPLEGGNVICHAQQFVDLGNDGQGHNISYKLSHVPLACQQLSFSWCPWSKIFRVYRSISLSIMFRRGLPRSMWHILNSRPACWKST